MYSDIYQRRLCYAQSVRELRPHGLKESRPTIRRDEDQGIGYSEGFGKSRHIIPIALLVKLQRSRKDLYKAVEGPSTLSILPLMITGSGHNFDVKGV